MTGLGSVLRRRRRELGLTQQDVADRAGMSVRAVRALENGQVAHPRQETVRRLASAGLTDLPESESRAGVEIGVLGPLTVRRDGELADIGALKQRCLLALLALQPGRVVGRGEIAEVLWEQDPPESWLNLVHTYVARLRAKLGSKEIIAAKRRGYVLQVGDDRLDLLKFDALVARGQSQRADGELADAAGSLKAALDLWKGPLFEDLSPVLRGHPMAVAVANRRMDTALAFADAVGQLGQPGRVATVLQSLIWEEPLHEGLHAALMLALAGAGQQAAALEVYRRIRDQLASELGLEPGAELRRAHERVLRQDLPPANEGTRPTPAELPADVVTFTGRTTDVKRLCELLASPPHGPVVVVTGGGGMGKSTLVTKVAHLMASEFPDGQLYVNLQAATPDLKPLGPGEALGRLLRSLGVANSAVPADTDEAAGRFRSLTHGKRMLIVLDDARDAAQVRPLLPGSTSCGVLVTSRRTFASVDSVVQHQLDVLSEPEALELLGRLAGPDRLGAEPQAAAELVKLCENLPLALSIAGARLAANPAWPVSALAARLADGHRRLGELSVGDSAVRVSFAASYQDLPPAAARMFRLLGLWDASRVRQELAAALADVPVDQAEDLLGHLVDVHLADSTGSGYYSMHDLLRLFARERADEEETNGDPRDALCRGLRFYLATARTATATLNPALMWRNTMGPAAGDGLELTDNQAVTAWVGKEAQNLLNAIRQAARKGEDRLAVALAAAAFLPLHDRCRWQDQLALQETVLQSAIRSRDRRLQAVAHNDLGLVQSRLGLLTEATGNLERALALFRGLGEKRPQSHALTGLAASHRRKGEFGQALVYYQAALILDREHGDMNSEAFNLTNLGMTHTRLGRLRAAVEALTAACEIAGEIGDDRARSGALADLAETHRLAGNPELAVGPFEESLAIERQAGSPGTYWEAERLWGLGLALKDLGHIERARSCWRESSGILHNLGFITAAEKQAIDASPVPSTPRVILRMP